MSLMHETATNRARTAIQILVCTPDSKIDVPIVQLHGHISNGVRQIPANSDSFASSVSSDPWHIEELSGVKLNAWEEKQCSVGSMLVDDRHDMLSRHKWTVL